MNRFKTSDTLLDAVVNVLKRRAVLFRIVEENGAKYVETSLSGEKFHKVVVRAKMEKLQEENNSDIPYLSATEVDDPLVLQEVGTAYILK